MEKNVPSKRTAPRNTLAMIAGVALLGGLLVSDSVVEHGWQSALVTLAVVVVITGVQYVAFRCTRPKQVRLLLTGEVITLPGGRQP
jgi:hypothetical protein